MRRVLNIFVLLLTVVFLMNCSEDGPMHDIMNQSASTAKQGGSGGGGGETDIAGNNLSFPVIWAESVPKTLPGTFGNLALTGEWYYWWGLEGTDPNIVPLSCLPDLANGDPVCLDGFEPTGDELVKAWVQKDPYNTWQAWARNWYAGPVHIDQIDWGDNLESVDWSVRSQVRTEVVLYKYNTGPIPWLEYQMRHVSGWGIDEQHGLATTLDDEPLLGPGDRATIYSPCARLTLQRLLVDRDNELLDELIWIEGEGWTEGPGYDGPPLINPPLYNKAVYEAGTGPSYYSAEVNVKGKIIYGYTWKTSQMNEGEGDYRITFSFDNDCGSVSLNTFFTGSTEIIVPIEEETALAFASEEETDNGGGKGNIDVANNLTYMDITLTGSSGGGGGGGGHNGGGGQGGSGSGSGGQGGSGGSEGSGHNTDLQTTRGGTPNGFGYAK